MAGGKVELSSGIFNTAAAVTMIGTTSGSTILEGRGLRATWIKRVTGQSFDILDIGNGTDWIYDCEVRDLNLHGYDAAASSAGIGINIQKADNVRLSSVMVNFVQDGIHVTTGTQYMQWDWVVVENFNQYGLFFDQVSGNPGHYLLNGVQVSIPAAVTGCTGVYFAARTDASFYPISFNDLSIWCPADSVTNSVGIDIGGAGSTASSVVDNLSLNGGMIEGTYYGVYVRDNSSRNIVLNGTTFPGNNQTYRGVVGTNYIGNVFLNNCYFMDVTAGSAVAVDSTLLEYVVLDNCKFYNCDTNIGGKNYRVRDATTERQSVKSTVMDLSGAAIADEVLFHAVAACTLRSLTVVYQEASSADAGVALKVGKESDDDYYYTGTSAISKSAWDEVTLTLLQNTLAAGDTLVCSSAGGKVGTGTAQFIVEYSYN